MNIINQIQIHYLRPSRTIETLEIKLGYKKRNCFVYNYEGNSFRFFENQAALDAFLKHGKEPKFIFENELELDLFLQEYELPL